ncbi:NADH-quinone oxidoreductase subunit L [Spirosoma luteum]|uniref:NADH-quinone oxidoreductase subunit 5 family protein n=1 Tax=Spirosoma luteum TaxID=431553 RepID=UPI0012F985D3|nr:NADH-quinone oxidoreductase subunit L [Spirosoma luteum]
MLRIRNGRLPIIAASLSLAAALFLLNSGGKSLSANYFYPGLPNQPFQLQATNSALVLTTVILLVALSIFIYSPQYMRKENGKNWFWGGISLFLSAMLLLVFAGDWVLFITAWEIMGFASFLLIATWYEKPEAQQGAVKAFMLTRFTDMGLYLGIFVVILTSGNAQVFHGTASQISTLGGLFFLLAVMGKSAQVPFQSWLSGAMAGPTPVSALLHSATMVAAGAVLLFRIYPLLNEDVLLVTGLVGGTTILVTGLTAIASRDVKQLLAASTSSQLGFMLLAIGAGSPGAAFAHWIAHAFMKSSLFLGAGIFQHEYNSTSFQKLEGTGKNRKATMLAFFIAAIALSGIPPLFGYWSKDGILAATSQSSHTALFFSVAIAGAFLTAVYMGKAVKRLWQGTPKNEEGPEPKQMLTAISILIAFVMAGGFFLEYVVTIAGYGLPSDSLSKVVGIVTAIAGLAAGWLLKESWFTGKVWNTVRDNFSIAGGYQYLVVKPTLAFAGYVYKVELLMQYFIQKTGTSFLQIAHAAFNTDTLLNNLMNGMGTAGIALSNGTKSFEEEAVEAGVYGISATVKESGRWGRKLQSGLVHKELVITVAGMLVLIFLLIALIKYA